ncbi:flagellar protein FlaG [Paenibacillus alba]|uniref:Flagellar protein FlaG n=1 Tax=Paenibacillus alba TaxID=1197127 RepID=A0ABU6G1N6_9BACL|nr:flagellar protein FlaG [Paenibacillus alba]MEC0227895.1 flagellar protein FlaG [Paenibacillus alba]
MDINSLSGALRSSEYVSNTNPSTSSTSVIGTGSTAGESSEPLMHKQKYELTISDEAIIKAIEKANKSLEGIQHKFQYSVHEKTGQIMVKVINSDTDEIIREIPNEKLIDLIAKFQEINGLTIDEKR